MSGLDVLNCGLGDLKLSFDPSNPMELERAKRAVTDMLRRGYVIFIERGGTTVRAEGFDPETCEYLVSDVPGKLESSYVDGEENTADGEAEETASAVAEGSPPTGERRPARRGRKRRVSARHAAATAIAPRAGG